MKSIQGVLGRLLVCWTAIGLIPSASGADVHNLTKPKRPVVLTICGKISVRNAGECSEFDSASLGALPMSNILTASPWHKKPASFSGPALKTVLSAVGAHGSTLKMIALDKYEITVPVQDANQFLPVLAQRIDGKELTVRSKGPLLMIYPFDTEPKLRNDTYYTRSIWQLQRIVVE